MTTDVPSEEWEVPLNILVILAHPDDPEFFCGATLARWARKGHILSYTLLTCGDKGSEDSSISADELCQIRHEEQLAAANIIGVNRVSFLDLPDGYLVPTLELRREVVRIIRTLKPDILVTCDPTQYYIGDGYINHPDHRYAGQVVLDAVFPAAGNSRYFPELLEVDKLQPHSPREVWISLPSNPNVTLDITDSWEIKLRALKQHRSQIGDIDKFEARMRSRRTEDSTDKEPRFEERFRRVKYR